MSITMRQVGPCFAAEVEGLDLRKPLTPDEVVAVHDGMDRYAVLVFHDQRITDEEQLTFTRSLGDIERAIGTSLRPLGDERLPSTFADVSNLDKNTSRSSATKDEIEAAIQTTSVLRVRRVDVGSCRPAI